MPYTPRIKQLNFQRANKDELVQALLVHLPDYHAYECKDFVDAYGKAVQDLLLKGKQVSLPYIGTFTIQTNGPKDYFNVYLKQCMHSYGSVTLKFKIGKQIRDRISSTIKKLLIQTMRLPADSMIEK